MEKYGKILTLSIFFIGFFCIGSIVSAESVGGVYLSQSIYDVEDMYGYPDKELSNSLSQKFTGEDFSNLKHYYYKNGMIVHVDDNDIIKAISIVGGDRKLDNSGLTRGAGDWQWLIYSIPGYSAKSKVASDVDGINVVYVFKDTSDGSYIHVWMVGELSLHTTPYAKAITVSSLQHPQTGNVEHYGSWGY